MAHVVLQGADFVKILILKSTSTILKSTSTFCTKLVNFLLKGLLRFEKSVFRCRFPDRLFSDFFRLRFRRSPTKIMSDHDSIYHSRSNAGMLPSFPRFSVLMGTYLSLPAYLTLMYICQIGGGCSVVVSCTTRSTRCRRRNWRIRRRRNLGVRSTRHACACPIVTTTRRHVEDLWTTQRSGWSL